MGFLIMNDILEYREISNRDLSIRSLFLRKEINKEKKIRFYLLFE